MYQLSFFFFLALGGGKAKQTCAYEKSFKLFSSLVFVGWFVLVGFSAGIG
jgi:hypothetical protein